MMTPMLVVSFGGGVNSAAMLVGMYERGILPDAIFFADTGGEKPETYAFVDLMRTWTVRNMNLGIEVVQNDGMYSFLERECLSKHTLPSLVFGWRSCSEKYKLRPQQKYAKQRFGNDATIRWAVGIDAGESHRMGTFENCWHPLVEWGWDRDECLAALKRADIPRPVKSACFFCPASTKRDVLRLHAEHPELFARAIAMERNATKAHTAKGLGRHWSWEEVQKADASQLKLLLDPVAIPCMCYDGDDALTGTPEPTEDK